ncbi:MAG: hypothetical protein JOY54_08930 [Acidobacteriaceae bacterium]|nr:hypothetical protein [Acidobacteriaceae bacterium]
MKAGILAAAVVVWIGLAVALAKLLKLHGADFWILAGGLSLLGILAAIALWWFTRKKDSAAPPPESLDEKDELELLFREADSRLARSELGAGARLSTLPVFFVLGERGAAKTTTVLQSGLEPELIAGQVYQDNNVIPTSKGNVWFARKHVFFEPAAALMDDGKRWISIVSRLRPGRLLAVRKGSQAPRAALVCVDTESFLKPGGVEAATAAARKIHARLNDISVQLGITFPVYVLFTRLDRAAFFTDFVGNLTNEEASQVFGVTLPVTPADARRIYTEEQSDRLTQAFHTLYASLAAKRPDYLIREHDESKLPGTYEFPREFRKLRNGLVPFLVELCRPSQLRSTPFLRGFYFTGVRPVTITETAPAPVRRAPERASLDLGATSMFQFGRQAEVPVQSPAQVSSRRIPQWVFLPHLFKDVLLADREALESSSASSRVSTGRRIVLAACAATGLILATGFAVSFVKNRALEQQVLSAAHGITPSAAAAGLPSVESLNHLESLRQSVATLSAYETQGKPLSLGWGLYTGSDLYGPTRRLYFNEFNRLLFADTQKNLLGVLGALPSSPGPSGDYQYAYDTLKAYLITTSHHEKSTQLYLTPVLLNRWLAGRTLDPTRLDLARKQFDFYSQELKLANPFSSENDSLSIERARHYLSQFAGAERVYQFMLAEANKTNPPINFNAKFPGSAAYVVDNYDVPGAFTKGGWATMQDNFQHVDRFFSGEQWVLGDQSSGTADLGKLQADLSTRYASEFLNKWREYLKKAAVVPYRGIPDAAQKLDRLSSAQSPLLAMFWLASQNTAVKNADVANAFKALYAVMPPSATDQYVNPANDAYMKALAALQVSLDQIAQLPGTPNDAVAAQTLTNAQNAKLVTRQMAQNFALDPAAHLEAVVQKLLEDPITNVEGLLRGLGPAELNGKGKGLCGQLSAVLTKFPFNGGSQVQATAADVNAAFKPKEGALWAFYDANLSKYLIRQGAQFVPDPSASIRLNPAFVAFFNRAAAFADTAYAGGSADPHFSYDLKPILSDDIQSLSVTIDGQTAQFATGAAAKNFHWQTSEPHGVQLSGKYKGGTDFQYPSYDGLWAVFEWVGDADARQGSTLEWRLKAGKRDRPVLSPVTNQPVTVRFDIDNPILQKGYFSTMSCTSVIAKP